MRNAEYVWGDDPIESIVIPGAGLAGSARMTDLLVAADLATTLGQIATSVNHRLRGPLTSIKGMAQVIGLGLTDGDTSKYYAGKIIKDIDRLDHMLSQVLLLTDQQWRPPELVNIHEMIDEVLLLVQAQAALQAVTISRAYATGVPRLLCDVRRVRQVILNLIVNALQAMPDGGELSIGTSLSRRKSESASESEGKSESTSKNRSEGGSENSGGNGSGDVSRCTNRSSAKTGISVEPDRVDIEFRDSGPGIPRNLVSRIFTPFFTTKENGTGLGLAVARHIAQLHGGSLELKRTPGPGALFVLSLPVKPGHLVLGPDSTPDPGSV